MGQSLSKLYVHLIFSTKDRYPFIVDKFEKILQEYIHGILLNLKSPALEINSMPDHIHILFNLSRNCSLADAVEEIKKSSSKWIKSKGCSSFTWQPGYAAFSVSHLKVHTVQAYIKNQKEHHKAITYKEEVEKFMRKFEVENFNEEYFWK